MKLSFSNVVSLLFTTLFLTLMVCVLNVFSIINHANDYHQTTIAELEASGFSDSVINAYKNNTTSSFKTEIINRSVMNEDTNLERVGRIYEVKTTYNITIPIINYSINRTIQGFAR